MQKKGQCSTWGRPNSPIVFDIRAGLRLGGNRPFRRGDQRNENSSSSPIIESELRATGTRAPFVDHSELIGNGARRIDEFVMTQTIGAFGRSSGCLRNALCWVGSFPFGRIGRLDFPPSKQLNATNALGNRVTEGGSSRPAPDKAKVNLSRHW